MLTPPIPKSLLSWRGEVAFFGPAVELPGEAAEPGRFLFCAADGAGGEPGGEAIEPGALDGGSPDFVAEVFQAVFL